MTEYGQYCPVAKAVEILGERWTLLIVRELLLGPKRFSDLVERLSGVSPTVLTGRLNALIESGIVLLTRGYRRARPPPPPAAWALGLGGGGGGPPRHPPFSPPPPPPPPRAATRPTSLLVPSPPRPRHARLARHLGAECAVQRL